MSAATAPRAGVRPPTPARGVAFDGRYIQDRYHGIGRYAFHLLRELAALLPGVGFAVLRDPALPDTRFDWATLARAPGVRVHTLAAPPFSAREQLALPPLLGRLRPRLYHTPYFALPWLFAGRGAVTVHDCIFERDARYMPRRWARAYYRLLVAASLARARVVFVPSAATAADVRRFYRVPARKLVVTPEAAEAAFRPRPGAPALVALRARYSLPEHFVLAVGARRPHKNFSRLVEAVAGLAGATLAFVGEADERFPDATAAVARDLGDRVRFLGQVSEADLPLLYNLATVVACPSLIEGFGLPVLEAMASGTPVVCSAIPVFHEVAGPAALFAPPEETAAWQAALGRLLAEPDLRAGLQAAGLTRAAAFHWRRAAEAALPAYRRCGLLPTQPGA